MLNTALYKSALAGVGSLLLWLVYFKKRDWLKTVIIGEIFLFAGALLLESVIFSVLTYFAWQTNAVGKFLLPPHQSTYFYRYCFFHYGVSNLAIIGGSLLLGFIAWILFKRGWITKTGVGLVILSGLIVGLLVGGG